MTDHISRSYRRPLTLTPTHHNGASQRGPAAHRLEPPRPDLNRPDLPGAVRLERKRARFTATTRTPALVAAATLAVLIPLAGLAAPAQAAIAGIARAATAGAGTTGVPAGTTLKVHNGDLNITRAGTVISGLDIRGLVKINAINVTIKNSIIRGRSVSAPAALINNLGGRSDLKVIDSELYPSKPSPDINGINGYNFTLTRVDIHGVIDAAHITGSNVTIANSWLHGNLHYVSDPNQGGKPSHDDSIQIQKGSNIKVYGSTLSGSHNAGVQITQDTGDVSNFSFTNNFADGGACTINVAQKSYGPIHGTVIQDNKFGRNTRLLNCAVISPTTTKISTARNYYTPDSKTVAVRTG
ncbi:hypothetical protein [Cryobacterium luteum]|uniref:Right-handed parallel beta-helix repeat-containing protein n=1 Tax=Cryobacterium luteum TaxID=1424661 RepID=A0A1H8BLI9_9MICO|nr:hypothetical protein [Cryobacterium luteum]TFB89066.1 hypothetical protein E3O10_09165 [Cryobacterium luteum]SEM83750.1 hypothetical protein SAMN05216281_10227 [Cryobacterium luteum]